MKFLADMGHLGGVAQRAQAGLNGGGHINPALAQPSGNGVRDVFIQMKAELTGHVTTLTLIGLSLIITAVSGLLQTEWIQPPLGTVHR